MNIRLETPADYREVENLTREAFWNVYRPGWLKANGISEATYCPPKGYFEADENPEAFDAYDATFPPKQKLRLPGQLTYDEVMETSLIILRPPQRPRHGKMRLRSNRRNLCR